MAQLDPKYSFERFADTRASAAAVVYARQVAKHPGRDFNPLTFYGESGLGKTHLMHAIGNEMLARYPGASVLYVGAERFFRDCIDAIQRRALDELYESYTVDALLVDDIHFLCTKPTTQRQFIEVLDRLVWSGLQVVFTCDRHPKELDNLEPALVDYLVSGVAGYVGAPDFEERVAIAELKVRNHRLTVPDEAIHFIAKVPMRDVRAIEGALNRLVASSRARDQPIDLAFAREVLADMLRAYGVA